MAIYREHEVEELKRVAQEKGYSVEVKPEAIFLTPRHPEWPMASFPIDEIAMAIEWLKLWV
ncbi:MAG TPA: hypothetical protein VGL94_22465 [Ktedonobacteraceae bacterium]|jgi:hypothetical protein